MCKHDLNDMARMQPLPVQVTEGGRRAMQRYYFPWSGKEAPHKWIKLNKDTWIFTNDNSVNQYKALVTLTAGGKYKGVIRTMSRLPKWTMEFTELEDAQAWAAVSVYELVLNGFDFYGPDKLVNEVV